MAKKSGKRDDSGSSQPRPGAMIRLSSMLDEGYDGPPRLSSFDLDSRAGKRAIVNAQGAPSFQPDKLQGKVFRLVNWFAEVVNYRDKETKETRAAVTITMFDPDGKTCRFGSAAVTRSFDMIRAMYGDGPFSEPIYLRIDPYKTRNEMDSYSVMEVDPATVRKAEQTWE